MTSVELPEFDAEDPVWADLLWSAARRNDQSIVALAEHCRRHDAEPVLRWLADGPGAYRWLAGRLLVEGVPADDEHTAAFVASLGHSLRADLRMTHLAAADFLELATRIRIPAVREMLDAAVQGAAWDWSWSLGPAIATALAVHDPETVTRIAQEMLADPGTKAPPASRPPVCWRKRTSDMSRRPLTPSARWPPRTTTRTGGTPWRFWSTLPHVSPTTSSTRSPRCCVTCSGPEPCHRPRWASRGCWPGWDPGTRPKLPGCSGTCRPARMTAARVRGGRTFTPPTSSMRRRPSAGWGRSTRMRPRTRCGRWPVPTAAQPAKSPPRGPWPGWGASTPPRPRKSCVRC